MTKHPIKNLESELSLIEQQLKLVTELSSSKTARTSAELLDNESVLNGRIGFEGINWDRPEEKGQKILAGRTFALITLPPLPTGANCVEIAFRRFHSAQIPASMKVFLNGEHLVLTQSVRKLGPMRKLLSRLSKYFPSLYSLGESPYLFRSQPLVGSHQADRNMLTLNFAPRSLHSFDVNKHSVAMVMSVAFRKV